MAVKVVHVSDITGKEAEEQSLGKLVVHEHPDYAQLPATLEALPDEVETLKDPSVKVVTLEWVPPGARQGERMTVSLEDFNRLNTEEHMSAALLNAITTQQDTGKGAGDGRRRSRTRGRVNYATLEHAGEPHRGRITDAEKEIVRNNLELVNQRLREAGRREINPDDPTMKERYGL